MRRYNHLVQKPECCAITCLLMIIYSETGKLYEQEDLAKYFWVKIHPGSASCFNIPLDQLTALNQDEWISTMDSVDRINKFFLTENIPLQASAHRYDMLQDLRKFIDQKLHQERLHLWVEYHNNDIHPYDGIPMLHDSLIENFDTVRNEVTLVDPEPTHKPRITTSTEALKRSMSSCFGKETWILVVAPITS